jgi:hypothetical protein
MWSGAILIDNQLRQRIEEAAGDRLSKTEMETLICDCYDLISEFLRANYERFAKAKLQPHIYTVASHEFDALSSPDSQQVGRSALTAFHAVQIR